jgi:hypothetical protein
MVPLTDVQGVSIATLSGTTVEFTLLQLVSTFVSKIYASLT